MNDLKKRLTKELQLDINVKIKETLSWNLPVHSIDTVFFTVLRTKMDILMKMILLTFQKTKITSVDELSEILLVEPLFVKDLIDKMASANMIEINNSNYSLTPAGIHQMETGIFAHEPESNSKQLIYSPCHQLFVNQKLNDTPNAIEDIYRYKSEYDDWDIKYVEDAELIKALQMMGVESSEGNSQVVVSEIVSATERQIELVPCIEFHLYNVAQDIYYARVWNTLLAQWDELLEAQLNEKELKTWRELYA